MKRRDFLKTAGASFAYGLLAQNAGAQVQKSVGKCCSKLVPDTFSLKDHGRMALNGVLGSMDPGLDYEIAFLNILDTNPPYMLHWSTMVSGVMVKYIEALPMLRLMSGSKENMDIQDGFMEAMLKNSSEDGLIYDRALPGRPWNVGVFYGRKDWNEDYANMAGNGRYLAGLTYWYQITKDEKWKKLAKKTAERMYELAVIESEQAWYPNPGLGNDFSYPRKSGWTTKKPPEKSAEGFEGATMFYLCQPIRGFTRYYQMTGDERFLELSRKFANLAFQSKFWVDPGKWSSENFSAMNPQAAFQNGHFLGHFHGVLAGVRGMLDYALAANDRQKMEWARSCYEYARQMGISRLGLFTGSAGDSPPWGFGTEGCTIADMTGLAVALTDAGLGDYWDDIESYACNGLPSAQATDMDELKRVVSEGKNRPAYSEWGGVFDGRFSGQKGALPGQEITDNVLDRTIGAFGHVIAARYLTPMMMQCCTANCSQGLYYAWEGILRANRDSATVNMWMNRRSPNLDLFSYLPYEGKLLLQNKGLKSISIRKPAWARSSQIKVNIDGRHVPVKWMGNRIILHSLSGNEKVIVTSPVVSQTMDRRLIALNHQDQSGGTYRCTFRGNTAVKAVRTDPGTDTNDRNWYRIFRRDNMNTDTVPFTKDDARIAPEKVLNWQVI